VWSFLFRTLTDSCEVYEVVDCASYLVALSLEQEQGETSASDVWLGPEAAVLSE